ncbi:MAG: DNA-formamidopyrimidine glycosylase family protein [Actinomycetota bacterium]
MPEGDTIHRTAATLRTVLEHQPLERFEAPRVGGRPPAAGSRIDAVEARGKHLLIRFDDGAVLHTHMRMTGSWHTYRPGEPWQRHASRARVVIQTPSSVAVCFDAPVIELLDERGLARHPQLRALGPDLCAAEPDVDEALRRLDALDPATPIGVALLDQRVASGVGNVYRCEVLWACGADPFRPVARVEADLRRRLLGTAARMLRANLEGRRRRTVPEGLAVYDRAGRPCRRCGTTILTRRLGEQARSVWWCPACQTA